MGQGMDRYDLGYRQVVGSCLCGNEHSVSIKCGKFLH